MEFDENNSDDNKLSTHGVNLNDIIRGILATNPALKKGREVLEWVHAGPHRQSDAYCAAMYLFIGGATNSALDALSYAVQENERAIGFGLMGEMPPDHRTHRILKALRDNKAQLPSLMKIVDTAYKQKIGDQEIFDYLHDAIIIEEALEADIPYMYAKRIPGIVPEAALSYGTMMENLTGMPLTPESEERKHSTKEVLERAQKDVRRAFLGYKLLEEALELGISYEDTKAIGLYFGRFFSTLLRGLELNEQR
ncbi:hypothetical protein HY488_01545 [Candidatus Woesearchaeota archaeon]|nr:hypothetical protein [Candidatus Woesearchaeota archaeon]